jgi:hypothetical protein
LPAICRGEETRKFDFGVDVVNGVESVVGGGWLPLGLRIAVIKTSINEA